MDSGFDSCSGILSALASRPCPQGTCLGTGQNLNFQDLSPNAGREIHHLQHVHLPTVLLPLLGSNLSLVFWEKVVGLALASAFGRVNRSQGGMETAWDPGGPDVWAWIGGARAHGFPSMSSSSTLILVRVLPKRAFLQQHSLQPLLPPHL